MKRILIMWKTYMQFCLWIQPTLHRQPLRTESTDLAQEIRPNYTDTLVLSLFCNVLSHFLLTSYEAGGAEGL